MSQARIFLIFAVVVAIHVTLYYVSRVLLSDASWFQADLVNAPLTILCGVAPMFLFGYLVPSNPFMAGALAGGSSRVLEALLILPPRNPDWIHNGLTPVFASFVVATAIISALSAAAGAYVACRSGPNNSFKPNPLRSFKTPAGFSSGSA